MKLLKIFHRRMISPVSVKISPKLVTLQIILISYVCFNVHSVWPRSIIPKQNVFVAKLCRCLKRPNINDEEAVDSPKINGLWIAYPYSLVDVWVMSRRSESCFIQFFGQKHFRFRFRFSKFQLKQINKIFLSVVNGNKHVHDCIT